MKAEPQLGWFLGSEYQLRAFNDDQCRKYCTGTARNLTKFTAEGFRKWTVAMLSGVWQYAIPDLSSGTGRNLHES